MAYNLIIIDDFYNNPEEVRNIPVHFNLLHVKTDLGFMQMVILNGQE